MKIFGHRFPDKKSSSRIPGRVGLALGSGSARGFAHIGVIEELLARGIKIDCIAGTSIGAVVGAVHAAGKLGVFAEVARDLDWQQVLYHFFEVSFPRSGLIDGTRIVSFVRRFVELSKISDLAIPFCAVATDLSSGADVVIGEGDVLEAVRASIAIPGIFTPVTMKGRVLVDGGLVNPVPVNAARGLGADFVIAVDVTHLDAGDAPDEADEEQREPKIRRAGPQREDDLVNNILQNVRRKFDELDESARSYIRQLMKQNVLPNIFEVLGSSIRIVEAQIADARLKVDPPDLLIQPLVGHLGFMEFHKADEAIRQGRRAMAAAFDSGD